MWLDGKVQGWGARPPCRAGRGPEDSGSSGRALSRRRFNFRLMMLAAESNSP